MGGQEHGVPVARERGEPGKRRLTIAVILGEDDGPGGARGRDGRRPEHGVQGHERVAAEEARGGRQVEGAVQRAVRP